MDPALTGLTLLISDKPDVERDAVATVWEASGGQAIRVGRFWDPPPVDAARVRVYGNDSFCLVLAQKLDLQLVSPRDDLLLALDRDAVKRALQTCSLDESDRLRFPSFVKSAAPKLFRAGVYADADGLAAETRGLEPDTAIIASEIVSFENEVRCWILDRQVLSLAAYEGTADLDAARRFAALVAAHPALPETCVVDIGHIADRGWAVIEANPAWGAGLNGCDPLAAARCIARACTRGA